MELLAGMVPGAGGWLLPGTEIVDFLECDHFVLLVEHGTPKFSEREALDVWAVAGGARRHDISI